MKRITVISFFVLSLLATDICKTQWMQFQHAIGGLSADVAYCIIQTTDDGYALAGYTQSFGSGFRDFYIVKLDASGLLQWTKTVGGTNNDHANSIIQSADSGYVIAGWTSSYGIAHDKMYIIKLDTGSTLQWSRTVGGSNYDYANSIVQTNDGGYAVAGVTSSFGAGENDFYIVKLNSSGNLQWSKTVGGSFFDYAHSIIQTADGGYAVAGYTGSFGAGGWDMYIVKLDASGTFQWNRTVGGAFDDFAYSIIQTADGGYAMAGYTNSFPIGFSAFYIVKFDAFGTLQWTKTVRGSSFNEAWSIIQTTDGGYAIAGRTLSYGMAGYDLYIVKLNVSGTLQWSRTAGGIYDGAAYSIIQTKDGGYTAAGYTNSPNGVESNLYILMFDVNGNICGNTFSPTGSSGTGGTINSPTPTFTSPTSTVTALTSSTSTGGIVTTLCFVGIQPISSEIPKSFSLSQNYPNPFNPSTKIKFDIPKLSGVKLVIYDILGREVATLVNELLQPGTYEVEFDASNYTSGVYFYKLVTEEYSQTKKMILIK